VVEWSRFRAVLFDLDGVLTDTASIHAAAWKEAFDGYLRRREGEAIVPFDPIHDYLRYVDGKPRFEGVDSFLRSRGIALPRGSPSDLPGDETVCAVGNLKNELVGRVLAENPVTPYPGSLLLIRHLLDLGIQIAVVTSSANANAVLAAAGLDDFFAVRVDGDVAASLGLRGKPLPDPYLEAARQLGVAPDSAVVIEDATSGVAAGRAGEFGLVIGVARHDNASELLAAGADLVVGDLGELV
jgi:beta-phosphoglucomutase family hydrolase